MRRARARSWSEREHEFLRANYAIKPISEIAAALRRSAVGVKSRAGVLGLKKGKRKVWTAEEERVLRLLYPHRPTAEIAKTLNRKLHLVHQHANKLGLKKTVEYMNSPAACRLRRGDNVGIAYRFPPGHVPANKGLRRPGYSPGRMAATQFRKGQHPHTWKPIGSTRLSKEGYLQRKVTDTGYPPRDWVGVHILLWREVNGAIPPGHALAFKDGDKKHIAIDNLELISRRELMARNTVHNLPPELAQVIQLTGALKRKIRTRENAKEQNVGSPQSSVCGSRSAR